jgi:hypothetical protein
MTLTEQSMLAASLVLLAMPKCSISMCILLCSSGDIRAP